VRFGEGRVYINLMTLTFGGRGIIPDKPSAQGNKNQIRSEKEIFIEPKGKIKEHTLCNPTREVW